MVDILSEILHVVGMPAPNDANDVGSNIRAWMGRRRMTMVELSRRTNKSRQTLTDQINSGRVTVDNLMAIAGALGVDACELLPETGTSAVSA